MVPATPVMVPPSPFHQGRRFRVDRCARVICRVAAKLLEVDRSRDLGLVCLDDDSASSAKRSEEPKDPAHRDPPPLGATNIVGLIFALADTLEGALAGRQ
jgi:hypothetical protein